MPCRSAPAGVADGGREAGNGIAGGARVALSAHNFNILQPILHARSEIPENPVELCGGPGGRPTRTGKRQHPAMTRVPYGSSIKRRVRDAAFATLSLAWLGGCAAIGEQAANAAFVSPGKYDFHDCHDIATQLAQTQARELELRQLMDRSAQGPGGEFVNTIAYRSDYQRARAELKLLEDTAANKNCATQSRWTSERSLF